MSLFQFATCADKYAKAVQPRAHYWGDFELLFLEHDVRQQKDGQGFIFATFTEPRRLDANVSGVTAIALDVDSKPGQPEPPAFEEAVAKLASLDLAACAWTTFSHGPDTPRYRIVCPLSGPMSGEALVHGQSLLADALGLQHDPACRNPGRLFYAPACPPDMAHHARAWLRADAPMLSPEQFERRALLEAAQRATEAAKRRKWQSKAAPAGKVLERAVEAMRAAGGAVSRNETLNRWGFIVGKAASKGEVSMAEAEAVLLDAALASGLPRREAAYTASRALRQGGAA